MHPARKLQHFYQTIDGWFDFDDLYSEMVEVATAPARFVEIGAWLGKSTAFMAVEIANSCKPIEFFVVDTWAGSPNESYHQEVVRRHGGSIYQVFLDNLKAGGVQQHVIPMRMPSIEASSCFEDNSLDFVFIDGDHDFQAVREDVARWRRKVRNGGILAGHDIEWPGLRQAVQDVLPWSEVGVRRSSWYWKKNGATRGQWLRPGSYNVDSGRHSHLLFIPCASCPDRLVKAVASLGRDATNTVVLDTSSGGLGLDALVNSDDIGIFRTDAKYSFTQIQNWAQQEARRRGVQWLLFMHADAACADERVVPELLSYALKAAQDERVGVVFTAYDALCAFNMEAVDDVGPWDETFEWYVSDCDYYYRLRRRGWSTHQWPEAHRVFHEGSVSIRYNPEMAADERRSDRYHHDHYKHKWGGPPGSERNAIPYNGRA